MLLAGETLGSGLHKGASAGLTPEPVCQPGKSPQRGPVLHMLLEPPSVYQMELSSQYWWLLLLLTVSAAVEAM